jgi:hypothetical protein
VGCVWIGLSWVRIETGGRHFKCGKELGAP